MLKKFSFIVICLLIAYAFWYSNQMGDISAGIAFFLLGMSGLEHGFKIFTGGYFSKLLYRATKSPIRCFSFGCIVTALFQSSTLISLISISFISAGLISLTQGMGIVFGANMGSTFSIWLIAGIGIKLKLSTYALPLLVFGVFFQLQKNNNLKGLGTIILSTGFLLLGIHYIKTGFEAGTADNNLLTLLGSNSSELSILQFGLYIVTGAVLTLIMQSSHALLVLLIAALSNEQISLLSAIAVCIGSNIGTTATTVVGALNANSNGKRLACAQVIFKLATAIIIIPLLPLLISFIEWIAITTGVAQNNTAIRLSLFHVLFNGIGALMLMPLMNCLSSYLQKFFVSAKEKYTLDIPLPEEKTEKALHLHPATLKHPEAALKALQKEVFHLYTNTIHIIGFSIYLKKSDLITHKDPITLINQAIPPWPKWGINKLYKRHIKGIVDDINDYAAQLSDENELNEIQTATLSSVKLASRNFSAAVKNARQLRKHLKRAIHSSDDDIKKQYQQIRLHIASVLQAVDNLCSDMQVGQTNRANLIKTSEKLKKELHRQDLQFSKQLDELIKKQKLNTYAATTLIHDNGHAMSICFGLLDGTAILFLGNTETELLSHENKLTTEIEKSGSLEYLYELITENQIQQQRK